MLIHEYPISWYVDRLRRGDHFSFAGYSDAEWYCMMGIRVGERTGLGQVIDAGHGRRLLDVMRRRQADPRFLFAVPKCLGALPEFGRSPIDEFLDRERIKIEAYERDLVTDDLAREAGLFPLIDQLRKMSVVMIGPRPLRGLDFLAYQHFIEVSTPNLHREVCGIEDAVAEAIVYSFPAVYLVSAGVSAAIIIDMLHDTIPNSWFLDCGSIWDAFVGIGGQRQWRADLYADPERWERWKRKNLYGVQGGHGDPRRCAT